MSKFTEYLEVVSKIFNGNALENKLTQEIGKTFKFGKNIFHVISLGNKNGKNSFELKNSKKNISLFFNFGTAEISLGNNKFEKKTDLEVYYKTKDSGMRAWGNINTFKDLDLLKKEF